MSEYTVDYINSLIDEADRLGLARADVLHAYPMQVIVEQFNGVGPDRWPEAARDILTWLLQDVQAAVIVHDMDFHRGGSKDDFHEANKALGKNVRKIARAKYGWYKPRRWFLKELSYKLTEWTDKYGWEGWNKK